MRRVISTVKQSRHLYLSPQARGARTAPILRLAQHSVGGRVGNVFMFCADIVDI